MILFVFFSLSLVIGFVYYFFNQNIKAIYIIIFSGLMNFTLPPIVNSEIQIFRIMLILGSAIIIVKPVGYNNHSFNKIMFNNCDTSIVISVFIYLFWTIISVLFFGEKYSFFGKFLMIFDYSIMYFITVYCLKNIHEANRLFLMIPKLVTIMLIFGLIGYFLNNPWFGTTIYNQDIYRILESNLSYAEKLAAYENTQRTFLNLLEISRIRFTAGDPNSLGTIVAMTLPFSVIFGFYLKKKVFIIYFFLQLWVLFLTGSRTAIISTIIIAILLIIYNPSNILSQKKLQYINYYLIGLTIVVSIFLFFFESLIFSVFDRFTNINNMVMLVDAGDRQWRWLYHLNNLSFSNIFIGDGTFGFQGSLSTQSHNNYIGLLFYGGAFVLFAYVLILIRSLLLASYFSNKILGKIMILSVLVIMISGISQETAHSLGPNFIYWPIIALISFKGYSRKNIPKNQPIVQTQLTSSQKFRQS